MSESEDPKAVSRSVTMKESFWNQVDAHAKAVAGDRSTYIRQLVEKDMSGKQTHAADALSPTVIDELSKRLCGELVARELSAGLATHARSYPNQAYLLRDLLFALTEFFAQGGTFNGQDEDDTRPRITSYSSTQAAKDRAQLLIDRAHAANEKTAAGLNRKIEKVSPKPAHHD